MRKDLQLAAVIFLALAIAGAPFLIGARLWSAIPGLAVFALVVAVTSSMSAGWQVSAKTVVAFAGIGTIAVAVHPSPVASAVLIGITAGVTAYLSRWGLSFAVLLVPVFVPYLIHEPPASLGGSTEDAAYYAATAATLLAAGLWGVLLFYLAGRLHGIPRPPVQLVASPDALLGGVLIAITSGTVALVAMTWFDDTMWVWVLLTMFILTKPTVGLNLARTRDRTLGTMLGALGGAIILLANLPSAINVVIGVLSLTTALVFMLTARPYWAYATALTPAIILFDTAGQDGLELADERLGFTVLGAVLAVGLSASINYLVRVRRQVSATHA